MKNILTVEEAEKAAIEYREKYGKDIEELRKDFRSEILNALDNHMKRTKNMGLDRIAFHSVILTEALDMVRGLITPPDNAEREDLFLVKASKDHVKEFLKEVGI